MKDGAAGLAAPNPTHALSKRSTATLGIFLILLSASAYGTMPVLAKIAYRSGADTFTFLAFRFMIAAAIMWPWVLARGRVLPTGRQLAAVVLLGSVVYVSQALEYFLSVQYADVTVVAPLTYTYPIFVVILAAATKTESLTVKKLFAVLVAVVGAALTVGAGGHARLAGVVLALAAGATYSVYFALSDRLIQPGYAEGATAVVTTAAAAVFWAIVVVRGHIKAPASAGGWAATVGVAVVTLVGIAAFFEGLRRLRPIATAAVSAAEPVVSIVLSIVILHEALNSGQLLGIVLVLVAVLVARWTSPVAKSAEFLA